MLSMCWPPPSGPSKISEWEGGSPSGRVAPALRRSDGAYPNERPRRLRREDDAQRLTDQTDEESGQEDAERRWRRQGSWE